MLTSRKLTSATTRPTEDNAARTTDAEYNTWFRAPENGALGDEIQAQYFNDLLANINALLAAGGINNLRMEDTPANRNTVLLRAIRALVNAATSSGVTFYGLSDTPDATGSRTGFRAVGTDGQFLEKIGDKTRWGTPPAGVVTVATSAPTTATAGTVGNALLYGGHTFIYRELSGTNHIWDVSGTWASAIVSPEGIPYKKGIFRPAGYNGNGWASFSSISRINPGKYRFEMQALPSATDYIVLPVWQWRTEIPYRPSGGRGNFTVYSSNHQTNSFEIGTIQDDTRHADAPFAVQVIRIG